MPSSTDMHPIAIASVGGSLFRITLFGVAGLVVVLGVLVVRKWWRRG